MCGIAGFWRPGPMIAEAAEDEVRGMARTIGHRGPDDDGIWCDAAAGIVLAHRRLSIVDLSPEGHQPMSSRDGHRVIVFNGEIYNFQELRAELDRGGGADWRGHSDTEVMLAAIGRWGVRRALERMTGMFAFVLWDRRSRTLVLARDRFGEKPLYYGWSGSTFFFASELKALRASPAFRAEIDREALALYARHACVPAPRSIYRGIRKLTPGHVLEIPEAQLNRRETVPSQAYWSLAAAVERGRSQPFAGSEAQAADALHALLGGVVKSQMVADVPLGAFLSGGIDSSTIVALMQAAGSRPVKTFTIGFREGDYDEAADARAVAAHLGTDHTEWILSPEEARAVVPRLAHLYDEPFADSSQIPTHLVSALARRHVTVSLSGDAGDEVFGGYNRHRLASRLDAWGRRTPAALRQAAAALLRGIPPGAWDAAARTASRVVPSLSVHRAVGDRVHKLAGLLGAADASRLYEQLTSIWPEGLVRGSGTAASDWLSMDVPAGLTSAESMMFRDTLGYLPDDILVKVDRAAMGTSLETRVPFLDHRVVEFAWTLPASFKVDGRRGKKILREVLFRHVPRELVERPKMGFGIPLDAWLRGPLREWAESLLDEARLRREGFLDPMPIRRCWTEHQSGARNWQHRLWVVLMFEAWLDTWGRGLTG
ncbi:MAG: asparagine synthase (glutamine-hydrolyzing) [Betaproteobacteria bacterium]|nr:asparagine synthase (glutamine-hydrolyzing) [Betaproteobacteria bacterium]